MKERPILFNGPMVSALLDGSKTQTRRVLPHLITLGRPEYPGKRVRGYSQCFWLDTEEGRNSAAHECPYGQPGDRLWVRETHYLTDDGHSEFAVYAVDGAAVREHLQRMDGLHVDFPPAVKAAHQKLRPSIHMPRWASRITLEIVSVRVERLQDISEADAVAEGVRNSLHLPGGRFANENYAHLWWTIHGDGSWEANPWVWVIEFKRLQA